MQNWKSKMLTSALANLLVLASPASSSRGDFRILYNGQSVDDLVIEFMEEFQIPGLSVAIVQAPYITRLTSYGFSNIKTKQLVAGHTLFNIGQMTNAFTAIGIMQLIEDKKLKLEDAISQYISHTPKTWDKIVVKDLLLHTSGILDYTLQKDFSFSKDYQPEQIVNLVAHLPLEFSAGTQVKYSRTNPYLLGIIIEKVSGMKYEDYITQKQIEPLHLQHTYFVSNLKSAPNEVKDRATFSKHSEFVHNAQYITPTEVATGYIQKEKEWVEAPEMSWGATFASSGMFASAEDISKWDIGLAGDILIKDPKSRELLYSPIKLKDGTVVPGSVGWYFPGRPGLMQIEGNNDGYSAFLSRFTAPSDLVCVTLLANKDNIPGLDILARKIAGAYDAKLAAPQGASWSVTLQSPYSVDKTIKRIIENVKVHGGTIFSHINHSEEAKKVGLKLSPTQVISLGNPAVGTKLMEAQGGVALDLPLRIASWQDSSGQVWLSFTDPRTLGQAYHVEIEPTLLTKMYVNLLNTCQKAVGFD